MLILTRKAKEEILIGEEVRIQVVRIAGGQVRIGVTAPPNVPVMRGEIEYDPNKRKTGREPSQAAGANGGSGDHLAVAQAHLPNSPVLADVPLATQELVVPDAA